MRGVCEDSFDGVHVVAAGREGGGKEDAFRGGGCGDELVHEWRRSME